MTKFVDLSPWEYPDLVTSFYEVTKLLLHESVDFEERTSELTNQILRLLETNEDTQINKLSWSAISYYSEIFMEILSERYKNETYLLQEDVEKSLEQLRSIAIDFS